MTTLVLLAILCTQVSAMIARANELVSGFDPELESRRFSVFTTKEEQTHAKVCGAHAGLQHTTRAVFGLDRPPTLIVENCRLCSIHTKHMPDKI